MDELSEALEAGAEGALVGGIMKRFRDAMIPPKTHPKWAALVQGRLDYKFNNAAASMLLFQLKSRLRKDPSPGALATAIDELHAFCTKYQGFMLPEITALIN